jgi:pyruvate dehydrogenase (quinone)
VNRAFTGPGGSAQAKDAARAMLHGSEDRWGVIKEGVKTKVQEFLPHSSE